VSQHVPCRIVEDGVALLQMCAIGLQERAPQHARRAPPVSRACPERSRTSSKNLSSASSGLTVHAWGWVTHLAHALADSRGVLGSENSWCTQVLLSPPFRVGASPEQSDVHHALSSMRSAGTA